jgi:hypothetical protein
MRSNRVGAPNAPVRPPARWRRLSGPEARVRPLRRVRSLGKHPVPSAGRRFRLFQFRARPFLRGRRQIAPSRDPPRARPRSPTLPRAATPPRQRDRTGLLRRAAPISPPLRTVRAPPKEPISARVRHEPVRALPSNLPHRPPRPGRARRASPPLPRKGRRRDRHLIRVRRRHKGQHHARHPAKLRALPHSPPLRRRRQPSPRLHRRKCPGRPNRLLRQPRQDRLFVRARPRGRNPTGSPRVWRVRVATPASTSSAACGASGSRRAVGEP